MQSHRRPRGKIAFESFCAVCVGASFVGAWVQTGAWAFLAPAFLFTLFGLYWSFDMFGRDPAVAAAQPAVVPVAEPEPAPEIRFEKFEAPVVALEPADSEPEFSPGPDVVPFVSEEPVEAPKVKAKKPRAKKAAPVVEPEPVAFVEPDPVAFVEEVHPEPHIEQLFDPQPFARQARPAFGKRPRGPGPRPLPA